MLSPLGVHPPHIAPTAVRTATGKAVHRAVLLQCATCGVKGTGQHRRGVLTGVNLAAERMGPGDFRHACGGRLVAFDIEEAS